MWNSFDEHLCEIFTLQAPPDIRKWRILTKENVRLWNHLQIKMKKRKFVWKVQWPFSALYVLLKIMLNLTQFNNLIYVVLGHFLLHGFKEVSC